MTTMLIPLTSYIPRTINLLNTAFVGPHKIVFIGLMIALIGCASPDAPKPAQTKPTAPESEVKTFAAKAGAKVRPLSEPSEQTQPSGQAYAFPKQARTQFPATSPRSPSNTAWHINEAKIDIINLTGKKFGFFSNTKKVLSQENIKRELFNSMHQSHYFTHSRTPLNKRASQNLHVSGKLVVAQVESPDTTLTLMLSLRAETASEEFLGAIRFNVDNVTDDQIQAGVTHVFNQGMAALAQELTANLNNQ